MPLIFFTSSFQTLACETHSKNAWHTHTQVYILRSQSHCTIKIWADQIGHARASKKQASTSTKVQRHRSKNPPPFDTEWWGFSWKCLTKCFEWSRPIFILQSDEQMAGNVHVLNTFNCLTFVISSPELVNVSLKAWKLQILFVLFKYSLPNASLTCYWSMSMKNVWEISECPILEKIFIVANQ